MRAVDIGGVAAWVAAIVIGLAFGVASAWGALEFGRASFADSVGQWSYSRAAGSRTADPYTRAIVAREGLLALNAREAQYFSLTRDASGAPLRESCIYELAGDDLAARWWSVTLYASDNFLAQNGDHAEAVDSTRLQGPWRVRVAPVRGEAAYWLSSRAAARGFVLMLRVYNADDGWRPTDSELPRLATVSCAGDAP
ncbi:hypothetical protein U91I_01157 [alpha proteobacterium U9-1i]|nr:hypothetical protein U91I_01157 [alpha proteobacterium U9-1i]